MRRNVSASPAMGTAFVSAATLGQKKEATRACPGNAARGSPHGPSGRYRAGVNGLSWDSLSVFHEALSRGLPPALVWGLTPRLVGLLFVVAFASLSTQLLGLI